MTSTSGDTTIRFHSDVPAIVCGECGYRTARVASLVDPAGAVVGTVIACLPCRERERARAAAAARLAARPGRAGVPRQRCAPAARPAGRRDSNRHAHQLSGG